MEQQLIVNGMPFCPAKPYPKGILADLAAFLQEWNAPAAEMELQTSGSTGTPKLMRVSKKAMRASAEATCRFFRLQRGNSALLCLPLRYIAGKMMVVRALTAGLNLVTVEPASTPLASLEQPVDFAPLVPMQAHTTLQQADGLAQLAKARTILLGGGFIDAGTEEKLQECASAVYASYGMTETLSHIALRRVNGSARSALYTPLPGISISLTARGTLGISAPALGISYLETNDSAEIEADGSRFRILGRTDAVINSGGIKIQAEAIEQALTAATGLPVIIVPIPHPVLGQSIGLIWEGSAAQESLIQHAINTLPHYHQPRHACRARIPRTATGKADRLAAITFLIDNQI